MTFGIFGCATTKPAIEVYLRPDVNTSESRVIVFPLLLTDGQQMKPENTQYSNSIADALFGKKWSDSLRAKKITVIPKVALDKIPGAYSAMNALIVALDGTSAVEQTTGLTQLFEKISSQFGDGALAFALIFEDEAEYKATKQVRFHMGLFDSKKLTWKWITKYSYQAGLIPVPYQVVVNKVISESYDALEAELKKVEAQNPSRKMEAQESPIEEATLEPVDAKAVNEESRIDVTNQKKELFNKATQEYVDGNYEVAIGLWQQVLELDPNHELSKTKIQKAQKRLRAGK